MSARRSLVALAILPVVFVASPGAEPAFATSAAHQGELTFLHLKQLGPVPYDVREGIFEMRPDGGGTHRLLNGHGALMHLASWSPDGTQLLFSQEDSHLGPCRVEIINADGSGLHSIRESGIVRCDAAIDWSPDGGTILFEEGLNLFTMNVKGRHVLPLTHVTRRGAYLDGASYSPDGTQIAFARESRGRGHLYVMDADGSNVRRITTCSSRLCSGGSRDADPQWSPDGSRILFDRERNLFTIRPNGSGLRRLTDCPPTYRYNPCTADSGSWSPDGSRIVFRQNDRLHVMDANGSGATAVGEPGAFNPLWRAG